jgi:signal transduction histidine kinase
VQQSSIALALFALALRITTIAAGALLAGAIFHGFLCLVGHCRREPISYTRRHLLNQHAFARVKPMCGLSPPLVAFVLAFVAFCVPPGAMATEAKKILLLHSLGPEFAPYEMIVATIRAELANGSSEPIAVYDASLDAGQTAGSEDAREFLDLLRRRFGGSPPDVVITVGPPAAAVYPQNRDKVFPAASLVIAGLDERFIPRSALRNGDAAVANHQNVPGLVGNILQVLPNTQTIEVVLGDTPLERYWADDSRKQFAQFANRVKLEWLNDLTLDQMRARLASLPAHSAVLYAFVMIDAAGVPYERGVALQRLLEVSAAPVFSIAESEVGHGVVGGPYESQHREGKLVAAAALRALRGQNISKPMIQVVDDEAPVYDWRELKHWHIDPARLPAGSEIRFRPPSLWDEHRTLIASSISILLLQAALLIGLAWQRIRRRRAEGEAITLSGRLITAHEDERRWLARELHDDITQRLAGLAIDASKLCAAGLSPSDIEARRSIRGGLAQLSEDVHDLSYQLHPSVLDDLGLAEALKAECERVARVESVQVNFQMDNLPDAMPKDIALGIYRVAQEALRNIARHAKAGLVQLSLALSNGGLILTVTDNGCGFDPGVRSRQQSIGQASMRERMRSLGGKLDIQSTPGVGTTVVAWAPIPKSPL